MDGAALDTDQPGDRIPGIGFDGALAAGQGKLALALDALDGGDGEHGAEIHTAPTPHKPASAAGFLKTDRLRPDRAWGFAANPLRNA
jgi:hypothetical protein